LPALELITSRLFFMVLGVVICIAGPLASFLVGTVLWVALMRASRLLPEPAIEATVRKGPFLMAG